MTTQTLFGASPTIGFPDNAEDTYSMATRVTFAVAGTISGARIWGATNAISTSAFAAIYSTAGVQQVAKAMVGYSTGAWNTVTFNTPFAVGAGETYDIVFGPINRYAANGSTLPLTNGDLTGTQGRFIATASLAFPNTVSGGGTGATWFGIDVLFDASTGQTIAVGTATETDAAFTVARVKTRAVGTATETDSATAIAGRAKRKTIGTATETDAAIAITTTVPDVAGSATSSVSAPTSTTSAVSAVTATTSTVGGAG